MRNALLTILFISVLFCCSDDYDDSKAWKDIDNIYKDLDQLKEQLDILQIQMDALSQIINGGAITSINELATGGYTVYYKGNDNVEHSFVIATKDQMTELPIIGIEKEGDIYYWTTTVGGKTDFLLDDDNKKIGIGA